MGCLSTRGVGDVATVLHVSRFSPFYSSFHVSEFQSLLYCKLIQIYGPGREESGLGLKDPEEGQCKP